MVVEVNSWGASCDGGLGVSGDGDLGASGGGGGGGSVLRRSRGSRSGARRGGGYGGGGRTLELGEREEENGWAEGLSGSGLGAGNATARGTPFHFLH
jgi:hypothetical protein